MDRVYHDKVSFSWFIFCKIRFIVQGQFRKDWFRSEFSSHWLSGTLSKKYDCAQLNCQRHFAMGDPVLEDESMLPKSHYMTYNQKKIEKLYIVS